MGVPKSRRRGLSLEYRLPLLISSLWLVLVSLGSLLAYREVRSSALYAGSQRLERVSRQLADLIETGTVQRIDRIRGVAASRPVQALLRGGAVDTAAALAALGELVTPADTGLPVEVWGPQRRVLLRRGGYPPGWKPDDALRARAVVGTSDSASYSPLFTERGRAYTWAAVPVERAGRRAGMVVQLRHVGNAASAGQMSELIGPGVAVLFANGGAGPWVRLDGEIVPAALPSLPFQLATYADSAGARHFVRAVHVGSAPFAILVTSPLSTVLARPATFLRRLLVGAALLLMLGAVGAWLLSRRVTLPVRALSRAARDIAAGDYTRRIELDRGDELGALAATFSAMAEEVQSTHEALRAKYTEASQLAAKLESTNRELLSAMETVERARAEAETASRAKSEFLATMSHEIRTPINAIIGYTDLLQLEIPGSLTPAQREQLLRIRASGRRLIALVDEVLDLSRIESGRLRVAEGEGRWGDAVVAALAMVMPDAEHKGVQLEKSCAGEPDLRYLGDPQRVEQILINLVSNAVKFTPPGGRVLVEAWAREGAEADARDWACLTVEDTGVGIPAEQQETIFEPFVQARGGYTREHGGAGLGLAISRRLARLMDGDIEVSSLPGRGSRFTLRLPLASPRDVAA